MTKELEEFIDSIDANTPEEFLIQASKYALKDEVVRMVGILKANLFLEGATVARVHFFEKGLSLILVNDGKVYDIDWCDGHGVTVSEFSKA